MYIPLLCILLMTMAGWTHGEASGESKQQCSTPALAKSINDFGADLTRVLGGTDNLFVSPMSIYTALAMTYLGARGETARQMENSLKITENGLGGGQLHNSFKNMLDTFKNSNEDYSLLLANGMFLQEDYDVNEDYKNDIQTFYNAVMKLVDFARKGEEAKDAINEFVAENTKNKIKDFFKEPLDPSTVLTLINAIYFKGKWKMQFDEKDTKEGPFHTSKGEIKKAKFMTLRDQKFPYFNDFKSSYRFVEIPYSGEEVSMILAVKNNINEIPNLNMTSDFLCHITNQMRNSTLQTVQIPKFQLKYQKELADTLGHLGLTDLFSNGADLTGISSAGELKVSNVVHQAVIDVNEQGSEAAAATGVVITVKSSLVDRFVADRPFVFYIVDKRNNLVLFSGRVTDPQQI